MKKKEQQALLKGSFTPDTVRCGTVWCCAARRAATHGRARRTTSGVNERQWCLLMNE